MMAISSDLRLVNKWDGIRLLTDSN